MGSKYWIKVYHELLDDPLTGKMGDRLCWRMMQCFLLAGELDEGGWLLGTEDIAWRFRMSAEECETDLIELQRFGILEMKEGRWFVVKFAERQAPMTSTERVQRHREAKARKDAQERGYADVGSPPHAPPTDTGVEREGNDDGTRRSTDTDTEEDTEENRKEVVVRNLDTKNLIREWERSGGPITAAIGEDLTDMAQEAERHRQQLPNGASGSNINGAEWVTAAIVEARRSATGSFNTRYVYAILKRWMAEGYKSERDDKPEPVSVEDEAEWATERKRKAQQRIKKAENKK